MKIRLLHREIYEVGKKLPKKDRLGIHTFAETLCIEILALAVEAAFKSDKEKVSVLKQMRVTVEVLKHVIRSEQELAVINEQTYLRLAAAIIEISKMTSGWIAYTQKGA